MGARLFVIARCTVKYRAFGPVANSVRGQNVQVRHALCCAKCIHFARGIAQGLTNDLCCVVVLAIAVAANLSNICKEKVRKIPYWNSPWQIPDTVFNSPCPMRWCVHRTPQFDRDGIYLWWIQWSLYNQAEPVLVERLAQDSSVLHNSFRWLLHALTLRTRTVRHSTEQRVEIPPHYRHTCCNCHTTGSLTKLPHRKRTVAGFARRF